MSHHQQHQQNNNNQQQQESVLSSGNDTCCTFDPYNWENFFFGPLSRPEAERLLAGTEIGTFLLRDSTTQAGYSLSVKEATEHVSNYLIEKLPIGDATSNAKKQLRYIISNLNFPDLPSLLNYFKLSKLECTTLIRPLLRPTLDRVIGRFKFDGERISDLPFERGEILDVLRKPEECWWMARNCLGNTGLIPANYVKVYEDGDEISLLNPSYKSNGSSGGGSAKRFSANSIVIENGEAVNGDGEEKQLLSEKEQQQQPRFCPNTWVKVVASRWPSIYDQEALNIRKGELLLLHEVLPNGMCRGANEDGKSGLFPITYVESFDRQQS